MSIPGLGTLKTWGLIAVSFMVVIFWSLLNAKKAEFAKAKLKGEVQARKTGQAVNEAMVEGKNREDAKINKVRNSNGSDRTGFE